MAKSVPRDVYGFVLRGVTDAEQRARAESLAKARSRANAWSRKTQSGGMIVYEGRKKVKELVRCGLPPELRPQIWLTLSGAAARLAAAPGYYNLLCDGLEKAGNLTEVPSDVKTRFQYHPHFSGAAKKGFCALKRLVAAILRHNGEVGYSAGLTAMAAFVLVVYGVQREEEAFWVLASVLENRLFKGSNEQVGLLSALHKAPCLGECVVCQSTTTACFVCVCVCVLGDWSNRLRMRVWFVEGEFSWHVESVLRI